MRDGWELLACDGAMVHRCRETTTSGLYCSTGRVSDVYRETICKGGIPQRPFWDFLARHGIYGRNQQEDVLGMADKFPLMNEYWEDKQARVERINVPAYVLASYSTGLHTVGSFRGFEEIPHERKWLRVHPTQEWHDLYQKECVDELQRFFDCYLKGIENGWEATPRVRVSILDFKKIPEKYHVFANWPIPNTEYQTLHLTHDGNLTETPPKDQGKLSYQSDVPALQADDDPEEIHFEYTFPTKSHLVGYSKAVLYMSCPDHDNLDVFVQLRKADRDGRTLQNVNIPLSALNLKSEEEVETINSLKYLGSTGILRASHRAVDGERSRENRPFHPHTREERVCPGDMVKLEIGLWPTGIVFEAGEKLVMKVAGHPMTLAGFPPLRGQFRMNNKGRHYVHDGDSHVVIPVVPV